MTQAEILHQTSASVDSGFGEDSEYIRGLNYLRTLISECEKDILKAKSKFYEVDGKDDKACQAFLEKYSTEFGKCVKILRDNKLRVQIIDSELKIVELLNDVRSCHDDVDQEMLMDITDFWEAIKNIVDSIKSLRNNFKSRIFKRLKQGCRSGSAGDSSIELTVIYREEVERFEDELIRLMDDTEKLCRSFSTGIEQDLFSEDGLSSRVVHFSEVEFYPILRLAPDLFQKLDQMSSVSRQWIDRDQVYVSEVEKVIIRVREESVKKNETLRVERDKELKLKKSFKLAQLTYQNGFKKFKRLEKEVKTLEETMQNYRQAARNKLEVQDKKQTMVDFYEISISQTKKNYGLQLKKQRLVRQLKEVQSNLLDIETQLAKLEQEFKEKSTECDEMEGKMKFENKEYTSLKKEFEEFSKNVEKLQGEFDVIHESLSQLELIQSYKTSPELVEDFFDKSPPVQLALSLRNKILARKRRATEQLQSETDSS